MKFLYRTLVSAAPESGDYLLILRPEIPVMIVGASRSATVMGLVDTGSDNTILPRSTAEKLGIPLREAPGPPAKVFGGNQVQLHLGMVTLRLQADDEQLEWQTEVCFFDFPSCEEETVILGHAGFLDYFTATFDGKLGVLTLSPNDELPQV